MTFLEIRQRIAEVMGIDSTDTTTDANATILVKLKEWVNSRYRLLAGKRSWNWRIKDTIIQTEAEITTGTVDVTNGSTTITFSTGPTPSVLGWFIQFSDTDDWYEISDHTATQTGATLANTYLGVTNATISYTLRKIYYTLPSTTGKVLNAKQTRDDITLTYLSPHQLDYLIPDRTRSAEPEFYSIVGVDSNRDWRVEFYPVPNDEMNINFRHYIVPTELSADGDIPTFSPDFHEFLVWDVLASYGFMFLDDTRLSAAKVEAKSIMKAMIDNDVAAEDIAVRLPYDVNLDTNKTEQLRRQSLPIE